MRVVQVANFYGPRSGGLRTAVDRLGAEYCAAGHEVFLVVPGPDSQCTAMDSGVVRMSVPARRIPFAGGYRALLPRPVTVLLDELSPDAIEVSDRFTLRGLGHWGSSRGVRTVMISHERLDRLTGQFLPNRIARGLADIANRRTAGQYDTVLCTTAFARAEFDRIGATNVATVPLGVDLDMFHPRRFCRDVRRQWAAPEELLLVHCGRLSMEKRADRSIDTVGALRDSGVNARLLIIGDGPLRPRLERHAARLPVTFTGFIDQRDTVAALLATADVALAPGPHETFGLAALEALASGTPAVVSRTSALREVLTTDSGVCADNHPDALAAAVRTISERPVVQRRLDARRQAEHFTWPSSAQGMLHALGAPGI